MSDVIAAKQRLTDMLADLTQYERIANADLAGWDSRTAAGAMIQKREAEDQVKMLKSGYKTLITNSFVKVFVTGPRAVEFAAFSDKQGAVVINAAGMYEKFAKDIEPSLDFKIRTWTASQTILLIQVLQRYMETHKIHVMQQPRLDAMEMDVAAPAFEDVVAKVRKAIRNTNGDDLLVHDLTFKAQEEALVKKAASTVVPVIITGLSEEELQSIPTKLFGAQPNFFIEATKESKDEELVEAINSKIVAQFKKPVVAQ